MRSPHNQNEQLVCELAILALENRLDPQQCRQLNELLRDSAELRACYLECLSVHVGMKRLSHPAQGDFASVNPECDRQMFWNALAEQERTAAPVIITPPVQLPPLIEKVQHQKVTRRIGKLPLTAAIVSLAALLMMVGYVILNPRPTEKAVAMIMDMSDAKWISADAAPRIGQTIYNTTYDLHLAKGIVRLKYESGAEALIEGPAVFSCETVDSMRLSSGKVFANVPPQAAGFTITTPSSRLIDLGTQFGVSVQFDGSSRVQMYEGKASLIGGFQSQALQAMMLIKNEARNIDARTGSINPAAFDPVAFVRYIDSQRGSVWDGRPFDLADAVGGGNGFGTGQPGAGINPENGQFNAGYVRYGRMYIAPRAVFAPVPSLPFVDGVFIPDGNAGPQPVTTGGHLFDAFVATDRRIHHDIFNACFTTALLPDEEGPDGQKAAVRTTEVTLDGVHYGVKERPAIILHAPTGITFDLKAIGHSLPGRSIQRFRSIVGIPDHGREGATLDVIVLLDGICVFRKDHYTIQDSCLVLDIPIASGSRFLTLAATDSGDGAWWDLCVFGQPSLELTLQ